MNVHSQKIHKGLKDGVSHTHTFIVEGHGQFPFDMLRYDSCHPSFEGEAQRLASREKRQVTLTRVGRAQFL